MSPTAPDRPAVAVVIVSFNNRQTLAACLDSLDRGGVRPLEVIVVDNASDDGSPDVVRSRREAARLIVNPRNVGFARASNQGVEASHAPRVLFLNPDTEIAAGSIEALCALLDSDARVGAGGPRTRHDDGTIQVSTGPDLGLAAEWRQRRLVRGVRRRDPWALGAAEERHSREQEVDWVSGSCLMARRQALEVVGGFDGDFFLYQEDADLCRRLRLAGWRVVFTPAAEVRHHLGQSMARAPALARLAYHRSHLLYYRKHNGRAQQLALRLLLLARALAILGTARLGGTPQRPAEGRALLRLALGRD